MSKHIHGVLVQHDRAYRYRLQMARNVNSEVQSQQNYQIINPCVLNNVITNHYLFSFQPVAKIITGRVSIIHRSQLQFIYAKRVSV